jgi:N6-L-threonylcarbamoyladenine synthase
MNVLGIETSCDETSAAVVSDGRKVLSNVVFSQVELHEPYGGVVPEIACRCHVEALPGLIEEALHRAGLGWPQVDAVAATYGPGLASSLLVGLSAAKGLALRLDRPLRAIDHIEAHIYSVFLGETAPRMQDVCPFIALVVSGGHTGVVRVEGLGQYTLLGQTIDDAAGEAFDKGSNLLGLGYPGGPAIERAASDGDPGFVRFPRSRSRKEKGTIDGMDSELCFSFSGVKTALLYYLKEHPVSETREAVPSLAASYQEAIVDALVARCERALNGEKCLVAGGGVSLNSRLRQRLSELSDALGVRLMLAEPRFCGDNAAMIAGLAGAGRGLDGPDAMVADVEPNLVIGR